MSLFHKTLKTSRLKLRRWFNIDVNNLYNLAKDKEIGPNCGWRPHTSIYYSSQVLKSTYLDRFHFAIVLKDSNQLIGNISLIPNSHNKSKIKMKNNEAELGYWIGKDFWNKGFGTEAALKILEYGFLCCGYKRLWCSSLRSNVGSKKIQQKCGFKYKYSLIDTFEPNYEIQQKVDVYSLDKYEWLKKREFKALF